MQTICIAKLKPFSPRLHGAAVGEEHGRQLRQLIVAHPEPDDSLILDFAKVEGASASYLKRLVHPFFAPPDDPDRLPREIAPVALTSRPLT